MIYCRVCDMKVKDFPETEAKYRREYYSKISSHITIVEVRIKQIIAELIWEYFSLTYILIICVIFLPTHKNHCEKRGCPG